MAPEQQIIAAMPGQAQPFYVAGASAGQLATREQSGAVSARMAAAGPLSVQVCGRLVNIPPEASASLTLLSRHLASQLKMSGHTSLQFQDVAGRLIKADQDLAAALREGRHPLQASMTVLALREIEQKKSEVETKKEELAQFQWQVIIDQIANLTQQVNSIGPTIQGVRDDCKKAIDQARADLASRGERMEESVTRESQHREFAFKDVESKIEKLVQAVCAERSARDVVSHQLSAQLDAVTAGLESDRSVRLQERAEMERQYEVIKHQVDAEQSRNEEQWNWHMETAKRLDARLEERASADMAQQMRLTELEAGADRLRASVASTESALATTQRTIQEIMTQRQEELRKAVRDEMVGRENHIARFAKELETSWQSLEARLQRCREEATAGTSTVAERARILELRCAQIEHDLHTQVTAHSDEYQRLAERASAAVSVVDTLEMNLKASDVVTQTTASRVEEISERLSVVEDDCRSKAKADYWQPQMEALHRADAKFETKLATMEKEFMQRLQQEASSRDSVKMQLQESLKSCMAKILASRPPQEKGRFSEAAAAPSMASDDCSTGLVTPRCAYGGQLGSTVASRMSSVAVPGSQLQPCAAMPMHAGDKFARAVSPSRVVMMPPDAALQAVQPTFRTISPRRSG